MSFFQKVLKIKEEQEYEDDINFLNISREYVCIKNFNNIFINEVVLISKYKESSLILYIVEKDIRFKEIENNIIDEYFKLTRNIKTKNIINQLWGSGLK